MAGLRNKINFLAGCLLEAVEDGNIQNVKILTGTYMADCNFIIFGRGLTALHYACGMDDTELAEKIVNFMLDFGNGDPNVPTLENETPLHVASIAGRVNIVQILLEKGGDLEAKDNSHKTPIQYAMCERHYELIEFYKKYLFKKKITDKQAQITLDHKSADLTTNVLNDCNIFTPNGKNYNFDITSPYYINITHRRKVKSTINIKNQVENEGNINVNTEVIQESKNLFQLNEENLNQFTEYMSKGKDRLSLIDSWRCKVKSRPRFSTILYTTQEELDKFFCDISDEVQSTKLNFVKIPKIIIQSPSIDCDLEEPQNVELQSLIQVVNDANLLTEDRNNCDNLDNSKKNTDDKNNESFKTARNESFKICSPKSNKEFLCQMTEKFIHTDNKAGIIFYETRVSAEPIKFDDRKALTVRSESVNKLKEYQLPLDYDTDTLRQELTQFGDEPGPITKSTKRLYMKKLIRYKTDKNVATNICNSPANRKNLPDRKYSVELEKALKESSWQETIKSYIHLESKMTEHFHSAHEQKINFREGHLKTSFIYILIDPRVSENLPGEAMFFSQLISWRKFLDSIFYIGKGKSSRPYSHLYDAIKIYNNNSLLTTTTGNNIYPIINSAKDLITKEQISCKLNKKTTTKSLTNSKKLHRILDIWLAEKGVVCLHLFHNIKPAEAYSREALIIDAIGLTNVTNLKRGDYYGPLKSWDMRNRKQLGTFLLYKAFQIFLAEGESQLRPSDIK